MNEINFADLRRALRYLPGVAYLSLTLAVALFRLAPLEAFSTSDGFSRGLDIAYGQWAGLTLWLIIVALGHRVFGRWIFEVSGPEDRLTYWMLVAIAGYWLLSLLLFFMALMNTLSWAPFMAGGLSLLLLPPLMAQVLSHRKSQSIGGQVPWAVLAFGVVGLICGIPFFIETLLPTNNWDAAGVHLPLGGWLLQHGLQSLPTDLEPFVTAAGVHLVYALLLSLDAEWGIVPFNAGATAMTVLTAFAFARRFWGASAGRWAALACISSGVILQLGLDPRVDNFLALWVIGAAFCFLLWIRQPGQVFSLVLGGMALGSALGAKFLGVLPALVWGVPLMFWAGILAKRGVIANKPIVLAFLSVLMPSAWWYVASLQLTGDPIYPYLRGTVLSFESDQREPLDSALRPMLDRWRENREGPTALAQLGLDEPSAASIPSIVDLVSLYLEPRIHSRKPGQELSPLLLMFLFLPVLWRDRFAWILWGGTLSVFFLVAPRTGLIRYGILVLPLMAVGAGCVLAQLQMRAWKALWAAVALLTLVHLSALQWDVLQAERPVDWLSGRLDRWDWLSEVGYNGAKAIPRSIVRLRTLQREGRIDAEGRVLFFGEAKVWGLGLNAIPDVSRDGRPWLRRLIASGGDLEILHNQLWQEGVRYLGFNRAYLHWVVRKVDMDRDRLEFSLATFLAFLRISARPLFDEEQLFFFELEPPSIRR